MRTIRKLDLTVGLDRKKVLPFLEGATTIQGKFVTNAGLLANPPIAPSDLLKQIQDASTAHQATKTNKKAIATRTAKIDVVWTSLDVLCTFVRQLCSNASPEQAMTLAEASGFHVVEASDAAREILEADLTNDKGEVALRGFAAQLEAPSGKKHVRRTYRWRHSVDGEKTFVEDESTPVANTVISGLPLMTEIAFQVAVKDYSGTGQWSQSVKIFVH